MRDLPSGIRRVYQLAWEPTVASDSSRGLTTASDVLMHLVGVCRVENSIRGRIPMEPVRTVFARTDL